MKDKMQPWIEAGYELFAGEGPSALKVEVMARQVHTSKSSFYHHFADLDLFTAHLLEYHLVRARMIAEREAACQCVDPDLLEVILEFKQDLLFNRQLRVNRDQAAFRACFEQVNALVGGAILELWACDLGLTAKTGLAQMVLNLTLENFFLQITAETMTYPWLKSYFQDIRNMVGHFQVEGEV